MIKICSHCKTAKWMEIDFRTRWHRNHYIYNSFCRECELEYMKIYRGIDKNIELQKIYRNLEYVKTAMRESSKICQRKRYADPTKRRRMLDQSKRYRKVKLSDPLALERERERSRNRFHDPRFHEAKKQRGRAYHKRVISDPVLHEKDKQRRRNRLKEYPKLKLSNFMAASMRYALNRNKDGNSWTKFTDYTVDELKRHLEKQFFPGMSWANRSEWHIDHIIPISAFNFSKPEDLDFKKCWSLNNLRPIWAKDNLSKGARLDKPFQPCLALAVN